MLRLGRVPGPILPTILIAALTACALAVAWTGRESGPITVSIVGDIMLSRGVSDYLEVNGWDYPYEDVREIFLQDDLTVGNLECPITDRQDAVFKTKRFVFKAGAQNAAALKRAGFDCLNLANNHSMDYLSGGLRDTMVNLEESGLSYVGAAKNASLDSSYMFEKNGVRVGILAYSAFPPEGFFFNQDEPTVTYISTLDFSGLERDIASLDCDFKLVYFHWGIEYQPFRSEMQERIARKAIDFGADFVVGTHPHVLQDSEVYEGKPIYYSLGNFVFDRQIPPGTDEGMILQVEIGREGLVGVREIPVRIVRGKPFVEPVGKVPVAEAHPKREWAFQPRFPGVGLLLYREQEEGFVA